MGNGGSKKKSERDRAHSSVNKNSDTSSTTPIKASSTTSIPPIKNRCYIKSSTNYKTFNNTIFYS